jgi:hypothetical protein
MTSMEIKVGEREAVFRKDIFSRNTRFKEYKWAEDSITWHMGTQPLSSQPPITHPESSSVAVAVLSFGDIY